MEKRLNPKLIRDIYQAPNEMTVVLRDSTEGWPAEVPIGAMTIDVIEERAKVDAEFMAQFEDLPTLDGVMATPMAVSARNCFGFEGDVLILIFSHEPFAE